MLNLYGREILRSCDAELKITEEHTLFYIISANLMGQGNSQPSLRCDAQAPAKRKSVTNAQMALSYYRACSCFPNEPIPGQLQVVYSD
jgi:hypothetical protein